MSKLEIQNVSVRYGRTRALDHFSLTLEGDHICGLLGRNGAGKTTLMNVICGRLYPREGAVHLDGEPVWENDGALARIACMGEGNLFPEGTRVDRALRWLSRLRPGFDEAAARRLCEAFELKARAKIDGLSTGYASIFSLIVALASNAPVTLFDEPVLGLDANHRALFYRALSLSFAERPRLIVISTHLIGEAASMIDRAAIVKDGGLLLETGTEELLAGCYSVAGPARAVEAYLEGREEIGRESLGGLMSATVRGTPRDVPEALETGKPDLQKLFIDLTNA